MKYGVGWGWEDIKSGVGRLEVLPWMGGWGMKLSVGWVRGIVLYFFLENKMKQRATQPFSLLMKCKSGRGHPPIYPTTLK